MKSFFNEFKEFALKGNVMMIAVGVLIGGAFQSIITSFIDNILSPILGLFVGQNFDVLYIRAFGVTITYGAFITSVINFILLAFVVFLIVKTMNRLTAAREDEKLIEAVPGPICPYCKTEVHADATRCPACTSELSI